MKLYITLDDGVQKVERVIQSNPETYFLNTDLNAIAEDMVDTIKKIVTLEKEFDGIAADDPALMASTPLPKGVKPEQPY